MNLLKKFKHLHQRELGLDFKEEIHCKALAYIFSA